MKMNTATMAAVAFGAFALLAWNKTSKKPGASPFNPIYAIDDPFAAADARAREVNAAMGRNTDYLNSQNFTSSNGVTAGWAGTGGLTGW